MRALAKAFEQVRQAGASRTPFELLLATNVFFMSILSHCGNKLLLDVVISLVSRINFLRAQALANSGWRALYVKEIEEIFSAIQSSESSRGAPRGETARRLLLRRRETHHGGGARGKRPDRGGAPAGRSREVGAWGLETSVIGRAPNSTDRLSDNSLAGHLLRARARPEQRQGVLL